MGKTALVWVEYLVDLRFPRKWVKQALRPASICVKKDSNPRKWVKHAETVKTIDVRMDSNPRKWVKLASSVPEG